MADTPSGARQLRARQLVALRGTYPGWRISWVRDLSGLEWWIAELRRPVTEQMRHAGVAEVVKHPDAGTLSGTLSRQAALVHAARSRVW